MLRGMTNIKAFFSAKVSPLRIDPASCHRLNVSQFTFSAHFDRRFLHSFFFFYSSQLTPNLNKSLTGNLL